MPVKTQTLEDLKAELHALIDGVADKDRLSHVLEVVNDILEPVVDIPQAHKDELDRREAEYDFATTKEGPIVMQQLKERFGYGKGI